MRAAMVDASGIVVNVIVVDSGLTSWDGYALVYLPDDTTACNPGEVLSSFPVNVMDQATFDTLRAAALAGDDSDLAPPDKRSRPNDLAPGTRVARQGQAASVLCPGRGRKNVLVGWATGITNSDGETVVTTGTATWLLKEAVPTQY